MAKKERSEVPEAWVSRVDAVLSEFPRCDEKPAWTGARWRIAYATVAHIFGGYDGLCRLTFRARPEEVAAFEHMGSPYFVVGGNSVGLIVDEDTDWDEVAELLLDSYCIQAPRSLAAQVDPTFVHWDDVSELASD